ncbi:MAG: polyphosphate kinase 1 [Balneolales bacterium]
MSTENYPPFEVSLPGDGQKNIKKKRNNQTERLGTSATGQTLPADSNRFFNYELSWLKFNERVLSEALDERNPILERVKFLSIVCSNLDEFFQKRVGGLKRQIQAGVNYQSIDRMTPTEQLDKIRVEVKVMITTLRKCFFEELVPALAENGIQFKTYLELTTGQQKVIDDYFNHQLYPILTPLAVDQAHPFPLISNKSRSLAIELLDTKTNEKLFARIKIPSNRPRWLVAESQKGSLILVAIEDVIKQNINRLFPGAEVLSANIFRVTRNADVERNEEEADDLLEVIEEELRERRFAEIVRLEIDAETPEHIKSVLLKKMKITKDDVFEMDGFIGLAQSIQIYDIEGFNELRFTKHPPAIHPVFKHDLEEESPSIFKIIRRGDFMVHHPYHSFATSVQRFIEEASNDPKVLAIKQTLYRTSSDSPLLHSLMRAANQGKQVAVLIELKARFDEERNIEWAQKLEKAGVHVSYGLPGLKIHSKATIVVRQEGERLQRYIHLGTGNYHPYTAQLYEDVGLFSCNEDLGEDITRLFNFLTGFAPAQKYLKLLVAPDYMRLKINELINHEIDEAKNNRPARIIAKMNSLEDPDMIQKLYEASSAGVRIDLIVRGVCLLKPGIKNLSDHIRVNSIVGRFLEHSRIYYFMNSGADLYYIGSADWMRRNLDGRVESLVPIDNPELKHYLHYLLNLLFKDNRYRWELQNDGIYRQCKIKKGEEEVVVQKLLLQHALNGKKAGSLNY